MNDLLVLSSFEALRCEKLRLDRSEAELDQTLRLRGVLLKREEVSNQRQLTGLLVRVQMLQCESACLAALVGENREEPVLIERQYDLAIREARRAANDRKEYNERLAAEIRRLSPVSCESHHQPVFSVCMSEEEKLDAIIYNTNQLTLVRAAVESSPVRLRSALLRLEESARDGREKHMAAATDLSRTCSDLKALIVDQRLELRQRWCPEDAHRLVCWAEAVSKKARAKARLEYMHPVCMLDVVMLEGLRLKGGE